MARRKWPSLRLPTVLLFAFLTLASSENEVFPVSCLVAFNNTVGDAILSAVRVAVHDINNDPTILPGCTLDMSFFNTSTDQFQAMATAMASLISGSVAIVGPMLSSQAHVISDLGDATKVPLVSYSASDPSLSSRSQFPYFTRVVRSDELEMTAIADLVAYYGWREIVAVYTDDDFGRNGINSLTFKVEQRFISIVKRIAIRVGANDSEVTNALLDAQTVESSVFVAHLGVDAAPLVFTAAYNLGMLQSSYVWIASESVMSYVNSAAAPPPFAFLSEGLIGTVTHLPSSPQLTSFTERWQRMDPKEFPGAGTPMPNSYALFAYDATWLIAHALDSLVKNDSLLEKYKDIPFVSNLHPDLPANGGADTELSQLRISRIGEILLKAILNTTFDGLTGSIQLDDNGDQVFASIDVVNLVGGRLRRLGYWGSSYGLSSMPVTNYSSTPAQPASYSDNPVLSSAIWPGGAIYLPKGWIPRSTASLRLAVPNAGAFSQLVKVGPNNSYTGFCIEVFKSAVDLLPYDLNYEFIPFGTGNASLSYTDMLKWVANKSFDGAIGDITIMEDRAELVDFTQPIQPSGLAVVVPLVPVSSSAYWSFLEPFTGGMWALFGASVIFTAFTVWFLERKENEEFYGQGRFKDQAINSMWFALTSMLFSHDKRIRTTLGRVAVVFWLFVVLIITQSYIASLSSILTVQQQMPWPPNLALFISKGFKLGVQEGSFTTQYLQRIGIPMDIMVTLPDVSSYQAALKNGSVLGVIDEKPYLDVFLSKTCDFKALDEDISMFNWAFAFQKDGRLVYDLSTAITALAANGQLQSLYDFWVKGKNGCSTGPSVQSSSLGPDVFWTLFAIYGAISFGCCVIYLIILLRRGYRIMRDEHKEARVDYKDEGGDSGVAYGRTNSPFGSLGIAFQKGIHSSASQQNTSHSSFHRPKSVMKSRNGTMG